MAERANFFGYTIISAAIVGFIYPAIVHWTWGEGWLNQEGYTSDFAGSGVVHMFGGGIALVGATILGPRLHRFNTDVYPKGIPPSNLMYVTLGVFILWFGWFGFNAGSTTALSGGGSL